MKSSSLLTVGTVGILGSFTIPPLGIPLLVASSLSFLAAEVAIRYELKHVLPVKQRKYAAWLEKLDYGYERLLGNAQAVAQNKLEWQTRRHNQNLNLAGTLEDKYFNLFTQGRAQPQPQQPQTVAVEAHQVNELETEQDTYSETEAETAESLFADGADLPEPPQHPTQYQPAEEVFQGEIVEEVSLPELKLESLLKASFIIIWGCPGGGKTTLAKALLRLRENRGHKITVCDPHGSKFGWDGRKVIGSGRDYEAINVYLQDFEENVTTAYEQFAVGKRDFEWSTTVCDEFTAWADECSNAARFVKTSCSDIRKIHQCVVLVTHSDTLSGLGGASGMKAAIDRAAIKIQVEAAIDYDTGEYVPLGTALLSYPGQPATRVKLPLQ